MSQSHRNVRPTLATGEPVAVSSPLPVELVTLGQGRVTGSTPLPVLQAFGGSTWLAWHTVLSVADTSLDTPAGRFTPPTAPVEGTSANGVFLPSGRHSRAVVRLLGSGAADEFFELEMWRFGLISGVGRRLGRLRGLLGTQATPSTPAHPFGGPTLPTTTWRECDTLSAAGGSGAFVADCPSELAIANGFNADNTTGELALSLAVGGLYVVRVTTLPLTGGVAVGLLPHLD